MRLTDRTIQNLKPRPTGQYKVFDDQLGGFGVCVGQRSKSFIVIYSRKRLVNTKGRYPDIRLIDARREAKAFLATYSPSSREIVNIGFLEAVRRFLEQSRIRHKSQTTKDYARNLAFYGFDKKLKDITRGEVLERLHALSNQPVTQNHTFDTMVTFFNWCLRNELVDRHPLRGEPKPAPKRHRERALTEDELRTVYIRAEEYPFPYGHIVRLLILTGQRKSEILHLTWNKVGETLQFLDTKNRTDHEIPLLPLTKGVIESIPHRKTYLFENTKPKPFSAFSKAKVDFDRELDIAPYRLHDLRRTFSSNMAMLGIPLHVTERILNHKSGTISGVSAIYNRYSYMEEMKDALLTYENHLKSLCS
jgi:integrase